jgi:hypothetical protein
MEFKGQKYLDIREFFTSTTGEFVPTKKGVAIPIAKISELVTLVEQAEVKSWTITASFLILRYAGT